MPRLIDPTSAAYGRMTDGPASNTNVLSRDAVGRVSELARHTLETLSGGKTPREPRSAMLRACSNSSSCSLQEQHGKLRHGYDNAAADARRVPSTPSRPP